MKNYKAVLSDEVLDMVVGGKLTYCPIQEILEDFGLTQYVRLSRITVKDYYYDINIGRDENNKEIWKQVGSEDMLKYAASQLGKYSRKYQTLESFCTRGYRWDGGFIYNIA